jgi:hypothetical protein
VLSRFLTTGAITAAAATGLLAARGAAIHWVVVAAAAMSIVGAAAIMRRLTVRVPPGELAVLVGGRHRGKDRVWRGWRFVHGGTTVRLPGELVVCIPVTPDQRDEVTARIDAALFRRNPRDREEDLIRKIGS